MNTVIGYQGSVEVTIKNKTYRRFNHGCPELFKTLAMCLCRQTDSRYHLPTYLSLYSSALTDTIVATSDSKLSNNRLLKLQVAVHPYVEVDNGGFNAVFTTLILPDNVQAEHSVLQTITAALISSDTDTILAATQISGEVLESLKQGYSAQIKWVMKLTNVEV